MVILTYLDEGGKCVFKVKESRWLLQRISVNQFSVVGVVYINMFLLESSTAYRELNKR